MKKYIFLLTFITLMFHLVYQSFADRRSYVWTYEYITEAGRAELEHYFTLSVPDTENLKSNITEHQVALEVFVTENFDLSIYQIFAQGSNEGLSYEGFKFRSRFKIGQKGLYIVDPLIYLEYKGKPSFLKHVIESKLILAKYLRDFNISFNPIFEFEFERNGEWGFNFEPGYTIGVSYKVIELLRVGVEAKGNPNGHYISPVISFGREDIWFNLGSAFGIGQIKEGKPNLQIRTLIGIEL
ncbi:MAG: hypothetical protein ACP5KI_02960 [Brevinematia bacterium]